MPWGVIHLFSGEVVNSGGDTHPRQNRTSADLTALERELTF
jgi:hypothetical protein